MTPDPHGPLESHERLDYQRPESSQWPNRGVLTLLAVLSVPLMVLTGLAALDAAIHFHYRYELLTRLALFGLSCVYPVWWIVLRWSNRKA